MPWDYKFMPGNIVRNIIPPARTINGVQIPQFGGLTVLSVERPPEPGLGGFWITAGRVFNYDDSTTGTTPVLSGVDWQFELDPDAEQSDVPYYKVTQKRHVPPFYWPNLYVSIEDARKFIQDLTIWPYREPLRHKHLTALHIVDAYDWVLETYYLVKQYRIETQNLYSSTNRALFPYLAHIKDEDN